ncbi:MAG TPA: hypothetical protein VIL49_07180 [Capillimicrobium sp.]|jgi:hypothetical protein
MGDRQAKPDHTEPAGGRDTGSGGYPEEQPSGADPGPERGDRSSGVDAPSQDGGRDGNPGQATGNPGAAGGDTEPSGD